MLVCLCKGVSDSKIRFLVQNGCRSVREVMATCHAGQDCGSCICEVKALVEQTCGELEAAATGDLDNLDIAANE
jgi:bacterioferritin-associated ferredoxin